MRQHWGWTQAELARRAKVSQGTIGNIEVGARKNPRELIAIAGALAVNPIWLATGIGESFSHDGKPIGEGQSDDPIEVPDSRMVPVVGEARLGSTGFYEFAHNDFPDGHIVARAGPKSFAIRCRGDSMQPRIRDGEYVVVDPNVPPQPGYEVAVRHVDGRNMIKTLGYIRDGIVQLQSINHAYQPMTFQRHDLLEIYTVVSIANGFAFMPTYEP